MKAHQTQAPLFNARDLFAAQPVTAILDENETISALRRKNAALEKDWREMAQELAAKKDALVAKNAELVLKGMKIARLEEQLIANQKNRNGAGPASIPKDMWRRLLQLCHPDKHSNADAATAATQWLNANKP